MDEFEAHFEEVEAEPELVAYINDGINRFGMQKIIGQLISVADETGHHAVFAEGTKEAIDDFQRICYGLRDGLKRILPYAAMLDACTRNDDGTITQNVKNV